MQITPDLLARATGCSPEAAETFAPHLGAACAQYGISDTPERLAAFLAQVGHESGGLRYVREIASGEAYEGRESLGNTQPGDGPRYRGRGLIQLTGRGNARRMTALLAEHGAPDFEAEPEALELPQWAAWSAAAYWHANGLNDLADAGMFDVVSNLINTGRRDRVANGTEDRKRRHMLAKQALQAVDEPADIPVQPAPIPAPPPARPWPFPAGERNPSEFETPQESTTMPSFVVGLAQALLPGLAPLIRAKVSKEMGRHTDPLAAEQIAQTVVDAAVKATGKRDPIEAVAEAKSSQVAMREVEQDVLATLDRLAPLLDKVAEWDKAAWSAEEGSRAAARQYSHDEPFMLDTRWVKLKFIHLLSVAFVCFSGWFVTKNWNSLTPELKGAVITLMIIAGWNGVRDYWMGSSRSSSAKDVVIGELSRRPAPNG